MRKTMTALAGGAALFLLTGQAFAVCANSAGVVGGAAAGAGIGAAVGGPPGAAVGGIIGGVTGAAALPPTACDYVVTQEVPVATIEQEIIVGEPLPETVILHPIPETKTYVFANVNEKRVIVDPQTRVVVEVVN
jgi:hypothetical protein